MSDDDVNGTEFAIFLPVMTPPPFGPEEYSLLHFSLAPAEAGGFVQRTETCGVYQSIEEAFVAARLQAVRERQRLRTMALAASENVSASINWQIVDTEFGYDLKRDCLVVSRFWVHARALPERLLG